MTYFPRSLSLSLAFTLDLSHMADHTDPALLTAQYLLRKKQT